MNVWLVIFHQFWKILDQHVFKHCFCPHSFFFPILCTSGYTPMIPSCSASVAAMECAAQTTLQRFEVPSNKDLPSSQVSIFGWQLLTQGVQGPLKILVHHHALSWKFPADDWPFLPHAGSLVGHHWSGTPCWVHQNLVRSKAPQSCYSHCPPIPAHGFYSILSGGSLTPVVTPQLEWKSLPRNTFELPIHILLATLRMS